MVMDSMKGLTATFLMTPFMIFTLVSFDWLITDRYSFSINFRSYVTDSLFYP